MKKKYNLKFLPLFEYDLIEIVDYISDILNNPKAAREFVDEVEFSINKRLENPTSFAKFESIKERKYPYYKINVKNYSIFYVVIGSTMEVRRILYSKRDLNKLL